MNESLDHLAHVRADVDRMADLLTDAGELDQRVPACPDWSLAELIKHCGGVHRMVIGAVTQGTPSNSRSHWPPEGTPLGPWLLDGAEQMIEVLQTEPTTRAWSFDPQGQSIGFWRRRQAMENLIHRVDVEQALGLPSQIDPELAADGVAEVLEVMVRLRTTEGALTLPKQSVALVATDTGDRWQLGDVAATTGTVEAPAAELMLMLWKRLPVEAVTQDPAVRDVLDLPLTP